jgi:uncharacterized protein (TIGR03066 family)
MRTILALAVLAACGLAVTAAPVPKDDKKDDKKSLEDKLIGKWKMVKASGEAVEFDFFIVYKKGGEMEFHRGSGDEAEVSKGKFKTIDPDKDNKLGTIDWTVNEGGNERGEVSKINELTEDKLTFTDPEGVKEEFERVKEKKKEEKKEDKKEDKKDK